MSGLPQVKQFGLQRSGTNYLKLLLQENYEVEVLTNRGGWKHGPYRVPERMGREVDCVVSHKAPLAWLTSLHRYCRTNALHTAPAALSEFLRAPLTLNSSADPGDTLHAANPVQHWNDMHRRWLEVRPSRARVLFVGYADLLRAPERTLAGVAARLSLRRRERPFYAPERVVRPCGEETTRQRALARQAFARRDYYLERGYLTELTPADLAFVAAELDTDVTLRLGYWPEPTVARGPPRAPQAPTVD